MDRTQIDEIRARLDEAVNIMAQYCDHELPHNDDDAAVLASIQDIPALLDALEAETAQTEELHNAIKGAKVITDTAAQMIVDSNADRDYWKSRAEALVNSMKYRHELIEDRGATFCFCCVNQRKQCFKCCLTEGAPNWEFDQARFQREEDE